MDDYVDLGIFDEKGNTDYLENIKSKVEKMFLIFQ